MLTRILLFILVFVTFHLKSGGVDGTGAFYCDPRNIKYGPHERLPHCTDGFVNGVCEDCTCKAYVDGMFRVNLMCKPEQFRQLAFFNFALVEFWDFGDIHLDSMVIAARSTIIIALSEGQRRITVGDAEQQKAYDLTYRGDRHYIPRKSEEPYYLIVLHSAKPFINAGDLQYIRTAWKDVRYYETGCLLGTYHFAHSLCTEAVGSLKCDQDTPNLLTSYSTLKKFVGSCWIYPECQMTCEQFRQFSTQIHYDTPYFYYDNVIYKHASIHLGCAVRSGRWREETVDGRTVTQAPSSGPGPRPPPPPPPPPPPTTTTRRTTTTTRATTKRTTRTTSTPTTTTATTTTTTEAPTTTVSAAPGTDFVNNNEFVCQLSELLCHQYIASGQNTLRTPGQATTWLLIEGSFKSYHKLSFHMWPFTTCQTVHVCAGSLENINCSPQSSLLYDTMQKTLLVNGQTYLYDLPGVVLTPVDSSSGKYYFPYYTSLNHGKVSIPLSGTVQLGSNITILTSSPSCNVFVNRDVGAISHVIHTKTCHVIDHEFKSMAGAGYRSKVYNGLILNAVMSKAVPMDSNVCNNLFDFELDDGDMLDTVESRAGEPVFFEYTLSLNNNPRCALKIQDGMFKSSFGIHIVEPRVCKWVRLCFADPSKPGVCNQPSRNLDILPLMNIYIPTDTDNAQNFGVSIDELKHISFQLFDIDPSPSNSTVVMRMNYGDVDSHEKSIIEDMLLQVDFSKPVTMYLGFSAGCAVQVEEHMESVFMHVDVNQCLTISGCSRLQYIP